MSGSRQKTSFKTKRRRIDILGETWKYELTTQERVDRLLGESSPAFVNFNNRTAYFSVDDFSRNILIHEICHIYHRTLCIDTTVKISMEDREEITCEFMARNAAAIVRLANQMYRALT